MAYAIDTGYHVYSNWTPVFERRGAHHPDLDPYRRHGRPIEYSKEMCPRTFDILKRTVALYTAIDRSPKAMNRLVETVRKATQRSTV